MDYFLVFCLRVPVSLPRVNFRPVDNSADSVRATQITCCRRGDPRMGRDGGVRAIYSCGSARLKQFAGFIVGSKCDTINRLVTAYLSEALPAQDDVCFTVITKLTHGTFVLVSASVLIMVVGQYVMRASHHAIEDRFRRDSGRPDEDEVTEWGLPANRCTDVSQLLGEVLSHDI